MIDLQQGELEDRAARDGALDTGNSILVQAPAGSGKTELLATRFLKLLGEVDDPGEILAITFTRYATAEMRHRILAMLEQARRFEESGTLPPDEDQRSLPIARAALANSTKRGWRLLEQPQRLNIQSIDALCLRIAHRSPLSAGSGGVLPPTTAAAPLYRLAARRTLDRLGRQDEELNTALRELLLLRDSKLANCESLLAGMLATRDQWTRAFPLGGDIDWNLARAALEKPFQDEIHRVLGEAHTLLDRHPGLTRELFAFARYACGNLGPAHEWQSLAELAAPPTPTPEFIAHWRCLGGFLMTANDSPRKGFNRTHGFPPQGRDQKDRMRQLVEDLDAIGLLDWLREVRDLPPPAYTEGQWSSLRHIFVALRQAVSELGSVFADAGAVDMMEISISALRALQDPSAVSSLHEVRHLLVDEFQDTSRRQHELIAAVLHDWSAEPGLSQDGFPAGEKPRTFFLVGDPMQSIYMFRQADVELFDLVAKQGFATGGGRLPVKHLRLSMNFRSNAGVVNPLNGIFEAVFPHNAKVGAAPVDFLPGVPGKPKEPEGAFEVHATFLAPPAVPRLRGGVNPAPQREARLVETEEILKVLGRHRPRIEQAKIGGEDFTVAVLARAKSHLAPIAAGLRDAGILFRAVELETLGERQEILDLRSLTRALLHRLDRIAWLAVLRAPWCGLELRDLHLLCGADVRTPTRAAVLAQVEERLLLLAEAPRERAGRVVSVLRTALAGRYRQSSFSSWIERTWNSLGGPACVDAAGYENARAYFRMLETVSLDGIAATGEAMEEQLNRLFASPDPAVSDRCGIQLMTMHKAKGLGFDVVVLPGLHRTARSSTPALIRYLERVTPDGTELLVAPIDNAGDETSPLNRWVRRQRENREAEERKRLLYVACTRAREELHLFATATVTNGRVSCKPGSLLHTAWPAMKEVFEAKYAEQFTAQPAGELLEFPASSEPGQPDMGILDSVAATATVRSVIYRLPSHWTLTPNMPNVIWNSSRAKGLPDEKVEAASRPQGSRSSRILGTTVHALFERAAQLFEQGASESELRAKLDAFHAQAATLARHEGLTAQEVESIAVTARLALENTLNDPHGLWILKSHAEARTESSLTGQIGGVSSTLRIDRSFRAGSEPLSDGSDGGTDCLWIIDYKTATHGRSGLAQFLQDEKLQYAEQLESYGTMMRLVHGDDQQLRLGLYYPLLRELVWWPG